MSVNTAHCKLTCLQALYVFFKFFLKSKVVPLSEIDLQSEFAAMRREEESKEAEHHETKRKPLVRRILNKF